MQSCSSSLSKGEKDAQEMFIQSRRQTYKQKEVFELQLYAVTTTGDYRKYSPGLQQLLLL